MATLADRLGCHRFWLAEHDNGVTIVHVAGRTRDLGAGCGGVLPNRSPLRFAERN